MKDFESIVKIEKLNKSYSSKGIKTAAVLKDLSAELYRGQFTALVGPSGAGKSTLLHIIGTLEDYDSGSVNFFDADGMTDYSKLSGSAQAKFRNRKIGFIFQFHHLLPEFNALENVMMPALIAGESFSKAKRSAEELISITGVSDRQKHKPQELSGGEQQRIAIARALINRPSLVIADEPTGNLDSVSSEKVLDLMLRLKDAYGITFIAATHSSFIASRADRVLEMADGKLIDREI